VSNRNSPFGADEVVARISAVVQRDVRERGHDRVSSAVVALCEEIAKLHGHLAARIDELEAEVANLRDQLLG